MAHLLVVSMALNRKPPPGSHLGHLEAVEWPIDPDQGPASALPTARRANVRNRHTTCLVPTTLHKGIGTSMYPLRRTASDQGLAGVCTCRSAPHSTGQRFVGDVAYLGL